MSEIEIRPDAEGWQTVYFEQHPIRVIMLDGEPWFVVGDVCVALGVSNSRNAVARLDGDDVRQMDVVDSLGRKQPGGTNVTNEGGLYELIIRSDKPSAARMRRWVTHEVLPSIRKTGQYGRAKSALEMLRDQLDVAIEHERRLKEGEQRTSVLEAKVTAIEGDYDWYTALGYASMNGHTTERSYLMRIGKIATRLMREAGEEPHKRHDATFGQINTYPAEFLREAFLLAEER